MGEERSQRPRTGEEESQDYDGANADRQVMVTQMRRK